MSDHLYDLIQKETELSGRVPFALYEEQSITPSRNVLTSLSSDQFASGIIKFEWECGGNEWFDPNGVYGRMAFTLTKVGTNTALDLADRTAPAMFAANTLFQRAELFINDTPVDSCSEGSYSTVATLTSRLENDGYSLKEGKLNATQLSDSRFDYRQSVYASDGAVPELGPHVTGQTLSFRIPLSTFLNKRSAMPVGRYRLELSPHPQYKTRFVQTVIADQAATPVWSLQIQDFKLIVPRWYGPRVSDSMYLLDNVDYNVQQYNLAAVTSPQQFTFSVPESTFKSIVCFQSNVAGSNTLYPVTNFVSASSVELACTSLYVNFKGRNNPDPSQTISWTSGGFNGNLQRYMQTYNQGRTTIDMTDSPEGNVDFLSRGPFLLIDHSSDSTNKGKTFTVYCTFSSAPTATQLVVLTMSRKLSKIQISNGQVVNVSNEGH